MSIYDSKRLPYNDQDDYQRDCEAKAEFAANIAHDLRNLLNVINRRLELADKTGNLSNLNRTEEVANQMNRLIGYDLPLFMNRLSGNIPVVTR